MKLAELLNVDTTKENWFKLLSKKGINPKTVNAVSKGGGGDGGVKEYEYYEINFNGMHEDQIFGLNTMLQFYYYSAIIGFYDNIDGEWIYGEVSHIKTAVRDNRLTVKLLKGEYPYVLISIDDGNHGSIINIRDMYEAAGTDKFDFCTVIEGMGVLTKEEIDNYIIKLTEKEINEINSNIRYKNPITQ